MLKLFSRRSAPAADLDQDRLGNSTFPVTAGSELLGERNRVAVVEQMRELVALGGKDFDRLYRPTLEAYSSFVQLLPASQHHHHARFAGLLDHGLDVALRALKARRSIILPPNADPEVIHLRADRWTYGVFSAALFHDIGKPLSDVQVELFDGRGEALGQWQPLVGAMPPGQRYSVKHRKSRQYADHKAVGPFVARSVLPVEPIAWMGQDHELTLVWMAVLSGNYDAAGPIGEIVKKADGASVARDIGANPSAAPNERMSLADKLMLGFRMAYESGHFSLNKPGAAGWIFQGDAWMISKRCLDTIRRVLEADGHQDIPSKNSLLMTTLQEFGLIVPTPEDRAIWTATVAQGDFNQEFTLLRFPVALAWPNEEARPEEMDGDISSEMLEASAPRQQIQSPTIAERSEDQGGAEEEPTPETADVRDGRGDRQEQKSPPPTETAEHDHEAAQVVARTLRAPEFVDPDDDEAHEITEASEPQAFLEWIRTGIEEGAIETNNSRAIAHFTHQGLLLISPKVFKRYAGQGGDWQLVQKKLLKAGHHRRTAEGNNIIAFSVQGPRRKGQIKGIVLEDPEQTVGVVGQVNKKLTLETELA